MSGAVLFFSFKQSFDAHGKEEKLIPGVYNLVREITSVDSRLDTKLKFNNHSFAMSDLLH